MKAEDFPFKGLDAAGSGFDHQKVFAGGLDFSFPAVDRFDRCGVDVDAGGEAFLDDRAREFAGLG